MSIKTKEIRSETIKELERRVKDMRQKYMELRFQHASGTLGNPVELRNIRRDIARVITVIGEKRNEQE